MRQTRIYHGGPANTGSGGSAYPALFDRLVDELSALLLQGVSGDVNVQSGVEFNALLDLVFNVAQYFFLNVVSDAFCTFGNDLYHGTTHDAFYTVGNDEHRTISHDHFQDITNDDYNTVGNDFFHTVTHDAYNTVINDYYRAVTGMYYLTLSGIIVTLGGGAGDHVIINNLRSGVSQAAAGASANEPWHDTTDNTIKMGV